MLRPSVTYSRRRVQAGGLGGAFLVGPVVAAVGPLLADDLLHRGLRDPEPVRDLRNPKALVEQCTDLVGGNFRGLSALGPDLDTGGDQARLDPVGGVPVPRPNLRQAQTPTVHMRRQSPRT